MARYKSEALDTREDAETVTPFSGLIQKRRRIVQSRFEEAERKRTIVEGFEDVLKKYDIKRAFLFGSVLRGSCSQQSDIDFYVEDVTGEKYWAVWRDLEEVANQPVDLYCQLDDPVFVEKIKERGELVYESGC